MCYTSPAPDDSPIDTFELNYFWVPSKAKQSVLVLRRCVFFSSTLDAHAKSTRKRAPICIDKMVYAENFVSVVLNSKKSCDKINRKKHRKTVIKTANFRLFLNLNFRLNVNDFVSTINTRKCHRLSKKVIRKKML